MCVRTRAKRSAGCRLNENSREKMSRREKGLGFFEELKVNIGRGKAGRKMSMGYKVLYMSDVAKSIIRLQKKM